jgi:hypothetical protein
MKTRRSRRKRPLDLDRGADQAVKAVVLLAVTFVLLLVGFSGASVYITPPGPTGWVYIGVVLIASSVALVWLFWFDANRKEGNPSGSKTVNPTSKRIQL